MCAVELPVEIRVHMLLERIGVGRVKDILVASTREPH